MTRDFNKQNRDDSRSSFRNRPSNQSGEERSPRPARVRLNREMVDRAWENGAPSLHADYRARSTNGQPPRNNWRSNQNSSPNAPGGNRASGPRQHTNNNNQDFERRSNNGYQHPRPSSPTGPTGPGAGDQHTNGYQRDNRDTRGDRPAPYRSDGPRYNSNERSDRPAPYRSDRPRDNRDTRSDRPAPYQSDRPRDNRDTRGDRPAPYQSDRPRDNRDARSDRPAPYRSDEPRGSSNQRDGGPASYRPNSRPGFRPAQSRGPQINKPEGEHPRRGAGRYVHPEKEYRPHVNELKPPKVERPPHPRFLSRPEVRRAREAKRNEEYAEQFEGDYEQFDGEQAAQAAPPAERPSHTPGEVHPPRSRPADRRDHSQKRERFVTPLPDGRVLKGPRPVQRKNAQFWTDINSEAETLVDQVQGAEQGGSKLVDAERGPIAAEDLTDLTDLTDLAELNELDELDKLEAQGELTDATTTPEAGAQPVKRTPGTVTRKKTEKKPRSSGPKPSQKGYKWPTA